MAYSHRVTQPFGSHAHAVIADAHPPSTVVRIRKGDVDILRPMRKTIVDEVSDRTGKAVAGARQNIKQTKWVGGNLLFRGCQRGARHFVISLEQVWIVP